MKRRPIAALLASSALLLPPLANLVREIVRDARSAAEPAPRVAAPSGSDAVPRDLARFRFTPARWLPFQDLSPLRSSGWIDRGSEAGIRAGQVVVTARCALVGRVWKVYPRFALVQALDDPAFRVRAAARLASGEAEAIVRGDGQGGRLVAERLLDAIRLPPRALLRTTGADGRFPAGLALGYAAEGGGPLGGQPLRAAASIDRVRTVFVLADPLLEAVRAARPGGAS